MKQSESKEDLNDLEECEPLVGTHSPFPSTSSSNIKSTLSLSSSSSKTQSKSKSIHQSKSTHSSNSSFHHPTSFHHLKSKTQEHQELIKNLIINLMFIFSWYLFATLISLYNKWMFSPDHYNFQFPLFVSSCHMLIQFILASLSLATFTSIRPTNRPSIRNYTSKAAPCGIASGLDIGLSNTSLKTVTLSFYTMCKSSSLAFVLCFAFLFKLEKPTIKLIGIITLISSGVILMVSTETQFDFWGMIEVLSASCMGGLRWSLTQILLDKKSMGMNSPIATIFWLAPTMGITLALCSIIFEGWHTILSQDLFFGDLGKSLITMGYILIAGALAFLMTVSEYFLIQRTSVVTLSIAGIFKEVGTIFLSTVVFHDTMTPLNISGLAITLFGIALYNVLKYQESIKSKDLNLIHDRLSQNEIALESHSINLKENEESEEKVHQALESRSMRSLDSNQNEILKGNYLRLNKEDYKFKEEMKSRSSGSESYQLVQHPFQIGELEEEENLSNQIVKEREVMKEEEEEEEEEGWDQSWVVEEETGNGLVRIHSST
ncbi:triose-phosphate transporter family-domain-containing protein [Melampsora americana]|nr:triose-phosphate transporter family-domain-containing protein [Melampsora americana]